MALTFDIHVQNPRHTTLDPMRVACRLSNSGPAPALVPGEEDRTGALTFHVHDRATGALVRRMSGLSHQVMMSRSRVELSPSLEPIAPGAALSWTLDLASYHYTLPAGQYEVEATYEYAPAGVSLRSGRAAVEVSSAEVVAVTALHDNPVLEGTAVLIEAEGGALHLRQHNHARPLAAWYSRRLDIHPAPGTATLVAASFFDTASFDPFFLKWVLFEERGHVVAQQYENGEASAAPLRAPRPPYGSLCRSAFLTAAGQIFVFYQAPGVLRGYRLDPGMLSQVFEQSLPHGVPEVVIRADDEHVHVLVAHGGLLHHRYTWAGQPAGVTRIMRTSMVPVWYDHDVTDRVVKGIFRDRAASPEWMLVYADEEGVTVRPTRLAVPGTVEEIAFDRSPRGRFLVAVSTSLRRLYLLDDGRGPVLLARGERRFFPRVIARRVTYVGHFRQGRGYRFSTFSWRKQGPRLIDYDLAAWEQP